MSAKNEPIVSVILGERPELCAPLAAAFKLAELNTPQRQGAFVAQCFHESAGFTRLEENLNYSLDRPCEVWPSRFVTRDAKNKTVPNASAYACAKNPERLANTVYANRMGNGDQASGDGWRTRGRGWIMVTGDEMYKILSRVTGIDFVHNPDLACEHHGAAMISAGYWKFRNLNVLADKAQYQELSTKINGGNIGMADRLKLTKLAVAGYEGLAKIVDPIEFYLSRDLKA